MTNFVNGGFYVDYGRSVRHQWLLPTNQATVAITAIGILVVVACARLWRIFSRIYNLYPHWTWLDQAPAVFPRQDKSTPPLDPSIESEGYHRLLRAIDRNKNLTGRIQLRRTDGRSRWPVYGDMVIGIGFLAIYVGFNIFGVLTVNLQTNSLALSQHPHCGIWEVNITTGAKEAIQRSRPVEFERQIESALLAERCYSTSPSADGCSYFIQPSINFDNKTIDCPFGDMCYNNSQALEVFTPPISARAIGINAKKTHEFRRRVACSPLKMDDRYVQLENNNEEHKFRYYYGNTGDAGFGNATWETKVYGRFLGDSTGYSVDVLRSGYFWTPLSALRPPQGSITTVIFINSGKIFYDAARADPIFPATTPVTLDDGTLYYQNTRGHAGVIACIDTTELRDPSTTNEWTNFFDARDPRHWDTQSRGGFWLLWRSLLYSSIFQATSDRSGEALDAQKKLSNKYSLPLAEEQWKFEVLELFKASLARIQVEARDIARGAAAGRPGYIKLDFGELGVDICKNTYLFFSDGYININTIGYWVVTGISLVIILVALPVEDEKLWPEVAWQWLFGIGDQDQEDGIMIELGRVTSAPFREDGFIRDWMAFVVEWLENRRDWAAGWDVWRRF